jgi:solute carrier family 35, member E3
MSTSSYHKYNSYINAFWLISNVAAVVGIVTANKLVFSKFNFHFGTLLTVIHFAFTAACLEVGKACGFIERKSDVKWVKVLPLSMAFCGFVVLTNLSLQHNTVGFYQVFYWDLLTTRHLRLFLDG